MATRPYFTDAEVAALAAVYAEIRAEIDAASRDQLDTDLDRLARLARPTARFASPVLSKLLRLRFPGAALAVLGAAVAALSGSLVAAVMFGCAAAVFAALIAVNPRRVGGER